MPGLIAPHLQGPAVSRAHMYPISPTGISIWYPPENACSHAQLSAVEPTQLQGYNVANIKGGHMFFSKKIEQPEVPARVETLEWEKANRRSQSTRIIVNSWFIKTIPMLKYPAGCKVELTFEGRARLGTTPAVPVSGEIEIPIDQDPPAMLSDYWKNVPECVNGHASMSMDGVPQLFLTLYCTAAAMEWVQRVFSAGFSSVRGKTALDITLGYPDQISEDFWRERWQQEKLLVHTWDVQASEDRNPD